MTFHQTRRLNIRYSWTERTAADPSPTAAATRLVDPERATIVEIERHVIDEHEWLARSDSHLAFAISRLTPGTNLLAYCVGVGWRMRGIAGAFVALVAASLPSAALATALTRFFAAWRQHALTEPALNGAVAAAMAIMVGTAWTMVRPNIEGRRAMRTILLAGAAFGLAYVAGVSPIWVLLAAAVLGALWTEPHS